MHFARLRPSAREHQRDHHDRDEDENGEQNIHRASIPASMPIR
jgi:hypothetical protein